MTAKAQARGQEVKMQTLVKDGYYIFNVDNNGGFVIIAGDDRMPEVLGYAHKGALDVSNAPDGLKWLLGYYEEIAHHLDKSQQPTHHSTRTERAAISPLMATEWGQDYPYNAQCPTVNGKKTVTGCVATAMAQIMNYCRWPEDATSVIPSYTTASAQVTLPQLEPAQFNWTFLGSRQLAQLMRYCGQATKMDYGVGESGAFMFYAADALVNNFGYDSSVKSVNRSDYGDDEWEKLIYDELSERRAVMYSGCGSGDLYAGGHAFVVHGYDSGRFYIDWGWDGSNNGYFMLTGLNVPGMSFNEEQDAVIGIQPPGGVKTVAQKQPEAAVVSIIPLTGYILREESGTFPEINIDIQLKSATDAEVTVQTGYGLYDSNGMVKVYDTGQCTLAAGGTYVSHQVVIGSDVHDGDYYLVPVYRSSGTADWQPVKRAEVSHLILSIHDDLMKKQVVMNQPGTIWQQRNLEYVGISQVDGVNYDFYTEKGIRRAIVLPKKGGYSGELSIPDKVIFQGDDYQVYEVADQAFRGCMGLTSLSVGMPNGPDISNCHDLSKLEMREGVVSMGGIYDCPTIEQLDYPASVGKASAFIFNCTNLKTIRFRNPNQLMLTNLHMAWMGCPLTDIFFHQSEPPRDEFPDHELNTVEGVTVHIPHGTLKAYQSSIWKDFILKDDIVDTGSGNTIRWGWCQSSQIPNGIAMETTSRADDETNENYREAAIRLPSELIAAYKGCRITGIEFYVDQMEIQEADYVFVTTPEQDYLTKQGITVMHKSWNTISLDEPVNITGEDLFVGLGRYSRLCVTASADEFRVPEDAFWVRDMGHDTTNGAEPGVWKKRGETMPITIRCIIEGDNLPQDMRLCRMYVKDDKLYANIGSRTPAYAESFTIEWELDGQPPVQQVVNDGVLPNAPTDVEIQLPESLSGYYHTIKAKITTIDGHEDAIPANSEYTLDFKLLPRLRYARKALLEEFTGTWCGFSTRGAVGLKMVNDAFGSDAITLAIHGAVEGGNEPMALAEYAEMLESVTDYPTCKVNRGEKIDPYRGSLESQNITEDVAEALKEDAPAAIALQTEWADAEKTVINITTSTVIGYDDSESPFQICYVVVEDGLTGSGTEWAQSNNYAGEIEYDPMLEPLTKLPLLIEGYVYDNVPVAAWEPYKGVAGSVPSQIEAGKVYKYTFDANLTGNTHIQNKENLSVVAILVNKNTGEYINASKCKVGESTDIPDPIVNEVSVTISSAKQVPYYSEYNLDFTNLPELKAYVATGYDKAKGTIWLTRVKQVPAGTGFLLTGEEGDYEVPVSESASDCYYKNMFKGTLTGTTLYTTDGDYTNYYLSKGDQGVGFYKVTKEEGVKVGANRCYLPILTDIPANGSEGDVEMIKVTAAKQVPYYTSKNLDFSSLDAQGVKAYTATGYNYDTGVIWLTRVKKVPAQTGILVMADVEGDYNVPTTSVQSVYENMFVGSETAQTIYTNETIGGVDYVNYYLSKGDAGVGFYKVTNENGVKMGANRCYLPIPKRDAASGARGKNGESSFCQMILSDEANDDVIAIPVFGGMNGEGDGTTGIESPLGQRPLATEGTQESSIFNLQSNDVYYNLQGQRIDRPSKGLYIRNGRVVVIK